MVPFDFGAVYASIRHERPVYFIHHGYLRAGTLVACVLPAAAAILLARRFRDHPFGRRPVLLQHVLCFGLLGLAASHVLRGLPQILLWSVMATFSAFFWFLAYALMEQRLPDAGAVAAPGRELLSVPGVAGASMGQGHRQLAARRRHDRAGTRGHPAQRAQTARLGMHTQRRALGVSRGRLRQTRRHAPSRGLRALSEGRRRAGAVRRAQHHRQFSGAASGNRGLGARDRRDRPARRLPRAAQHVPAVVVAHDRRVLEPVLLLLQGSAGQRLLLSDVCPLLQTSSAAAPRLRHVHGGRGGKLLLPHPAGHSRGCRGRADRARWSSSRRMRSIA